MEFSKADIDSYLQQEKSKIRRGCVSLIRYYKKGEQYEKTNKKTENAPCTPCTACTTCTPNHERSE